MKNHLKTEKVAIEALGEELTIRELSVKAYIEVQEVTKAGDTFKAGLVACRYGVVEWEGESVESMMPNITMRALMEIWRHIYRISGVDFDSADSKNSDSAPSANSSTT